MVVSERTRPVQSAKATEELNAVDENTRQKVTWIIIAAVVVSLIILAVYRRHEVDNLVGKIASGPPAVRVKAAQALIRKQKFAEALEDRPRWVQDRAVQAAAMIGSEQALFQLIASKKFLDAPPAAAADQYLVSMGDTAIGPLIEALQDKDGGIRGAAKGPLVSIGEPAVASLMPLIDVYDDAVRALVSATLAGIGEPAVGRLLPIMQQLKPRDDQEPAAFQRAKSAAQSAFVTMKAVAFDPITQKILTDPNQEVRSAGATVLGQIANQTVVSPLAVADAAKVVAPLIKLIDTDASWAVRVKAAAALGPLLAVAKDNGAVPPLIARLGDGRPEVRAAAAKALGEIADPSAAGPLANTLITNRAGATAELATALERIGQPSIGPLTPALDHPEAEVRLAAATTIATIGSGDAVLPLGKAIRDREVKVRQAAAKALRNLADVRVLEPLSEALADSDWHVYYAASDALARIGEPAVPTLLVALGHPNTRVAYMAEEALARIGASAVPALTSKLRSDNEQVAEWSAIALGHIGFDAVAATAELLADESASVSARAAAARALGLTRAEQAAEPLMKAAKTGPAEVREAAVKALSEVGDASATEVLTQALTDRSDQVRETAMWVLKNWRVGEVKEQLRKIMESDDANAARRAAAVLAQHLSAAGGGLLSQVGGIGTAESVEREGKVRELLEAAAKDADEKETVRRAAITALGFVGTEASLGALEPLLAAGNPYAQEAAKAVGRIGRRAAEKEEIRAKVQLSKAGELLMKVFVRAETDQLRLVAAAGLSLMGGQPVDALLDELKTGPSELRPWAAATLGAIGKPATLRVLDARGIATDPEYKAWCAATLKLIGDAQALDLLEQLPEEEQPQESKVRPGEEILKDLRATL
jgi:HEAT repeat protein